MTSAETIEYVPAPPLPRPEPLRFYALLDRLPWPRSYVGKFMLVGLAGTHLPLLVLLAAVVREPGVGGWQLVLLALAATVVGTASLFWALSALVQPMLLAGRALGRYLEHGRPPALPAHHRDEAGRLLRDVAAAIECVHRDREDLRELAERDGLTGLLNRRAAERRLEVSVLRHRRDGRPLTVALLDVDHFKRLNDQLGHAAGDEALRATARRLVAGLRGGDWAARWGGEEFLVVLSASAPGARVALERLREAARGAVDGLTVSVGFVEASPADPPELAVVAADQALYRAKRLGRDRVEESRRPSGQGTAGR